MNYKLFGYFLMALLFPLSNNYSQETILKKEIVLKMLDSVDSHNQISFEMFRSERCENGTFLDGKFFAK